MSDRCTCATNPNEHDHRFLRPQQVAAIIGRPLKTVDSWWRRGDLPAIGRGQYGQLKVCVCCAAHLATTTSVRWVKRTRRVVRSNRRRLAA
jgi:hypothetical protein